MEKFVVEGCGGGEREERSILLYCYVQLGVFQAEHRTMAAFILAVMMNDYRPGQVSVRLPAFLAYTLLRFVFCTVHIQHLKLSFS